MLKKVRIITLMKRKPKLLLSVLRDAISRRFGNLRFKVTAFN